MRFTKIVCTMGPASNTYEQLLALAQNGMAVARFNFSHGTHESHGAVMDAVQKVNAELAKQPVPSCVALLLDTKGPEVRTAEVATPILVKRGQEVAFAAMPHTDAERPVIQVSHDKFADDVSQTKTILLDNGESSFDVVRVEHGIVIAKANDDASIGSRRHVNLPGAYLTMPSVTEKDWSDIAFGVERKVDFIALSFVRAAEEIEEVRAFIKSKGGDTQVIAKIETLQATEHIESIVKASDGIMVARGDLGAEVPFERVPVLQDRMVALCKAQGKPVIVATHMLESMIQKPMPTRAEVTDIAHAATTGTDATMLSGETANGKYPLAALDAMTRVLSETEQHVFQKNKMEEQPVNDEREARAEAAVKLASSINAKAIVVITRSGKTALDICKFRPRLPILAFTPLERVQHQLNLSYGTQPFVIPFAEDPETTVSNALALIQKTGLLAHGDRIVLVSDTRAHELTVNTVQVRSI